MVNMIEQYLKDNWCAIAGKSAVPDGFSVIKIGGQASSDAAANFIVFSKGEPDPVYFLKVSRKPEKSDTIEREFANLKRAKQAFSAGSERAFPQPLFLGRMDGATAMMVESFLRGRKIDLMDHAAVNGLFEKSFRWLKDFFSATRKGSEEFRPAKLREAFSYIEKAAPVSPDLKRKAGEILKVAEELEGTAIPVSSSQGDFDFDNILVHDGGISVADWEDFRETSHPFLDAEFFIFNLAMYYYKKDGHLGSLKRFFKPGSRTRDLADRHISDYCSFLSLDKRLFYLVSIMDTIAIIKNGYGDHKKVPMQSTDFMDALIDISLRETA